MSDLSQIFQAPKMTVFCRIFKKCSHFEKISQHPYYGNGARSGQMVGASTFFGVCRIFRVSHVFFHNHHFKMIQEISRTFKEKKMQLFCNFFVGFCRILSKFSKKKKPVLKKWKKSVTVFFFEKSNLEHSSKNRLFCKFSQTFLRNSKMDNYKYVQPYINGSSKTRKRGYPP